MTLENRDDGSVSLLGDLKLKERIRRQSPLLLGDLVLILPQVVGEYGFNEGFVIKVLERQVHVQTRLGFIQRKRENLWAITDSEFITLFERDRFHVGFKLPESYVQPPPREGVINIYYNCSAAKYTLDSSGKGHLL